MFWWKFGHQGKYFKEECRRPSDEGDRCVLFSDGVYGALLVWNLLVSIKTRVIVTELVTHWIE